MSTGMYVAMWWDACEAHGMTLSETRGRIAALLVVHHHVPSRRAALRYVRALIS